MENEILKDRRRKDRKKKAKYNKYDEVREMDDFKEVDIDPDIEVIEKSKKTKKSNEVVTPPGITLEQSKELNSNLFSSLNGQLDFIEHRLYKGLRLKQECDMDFIERRFYNLEDKIDMLLQKIIRLI